MVHRGAAALWTSAHTSEIHLLLELHMPDALFCMRQGAPGRGGAVGKRSRMRPGLPEWYHSVLSRPKEDAAGYDLMHIDVSASLLFPSEFSQAFRWERSWA